MRQAGLAVALVIACSSPHNPVEPVKPPPTAAAVVVDGAGAKAQAGKPVAVKGTARDAKLAAAVVASDLIVYCLGLDSWPKDVSGKPITAHGKLEETDEFTAKPSPTGVISAGTDGPVWVLRNCEYDAN